MSDLTPMMQQYKQMKRQYPGTILFFRLGDFYEMFFEDALTASQLLQITLTSRSKEGGKDGKKVPMCGVPHHAANNYIAKLIQKGYKVAICEQMEDPRQAKGIVKRDVIRVITPGTFLETEEGDNRFLAVMTAAEEKSYGLAAVDIGTGEFITTCLEGDFVGQRVTDELLRLNPAEILLFNGARLPEDNQQLLNKAEDYVPDNYQELESRMLQDFAFLRQQPQVMANPLLLSACCGALAYLEKTQKRILTHINSVRFYTDNSYMLLDAATRTNLELTEALRGKSTQGTLFWLLNYTKTAMGRRTLKKWIEQPLIDCQQILDRQETVEKITADMFMRDDLGRLLQDIYDLERLAGKIAYGSANPRDLVSLKNSLAGLPELQKVLSAAETALFGKFGGLIDPLTDIYELIDAAIEDDPQVGVHDGGIIRDQYDATIGELRSAKRNGKQWLAELEGRERSKTGIKSLKVSYNKVFGYYLEVSKSNLGLVPDYFQRKQTLVNGERYITPELKEIEDVILGAEDKLTRLEYEAFCGVRQQINDNIARIQNTAALVGQSDALYALAEAAIKGNYVKPQVDNGEVIEIHEGRHPVVEKMLETGEYIANDCRLDQEENRILLITGANMTGKSTYMRQVALIVLLAQIGSFVPARTALIGVVDRIFTRVGASDDLAGGQSTFMVEMRECQNILLNATRRSLIIMDEVGRGTSTFDGISIARAITEYIYHKIQAKTLFSTHYHELTDLERYQGISNYTIAVKEDGENIIFLRKVVAGKADKSYGIHVARLAGLPPEVISQANSYLQLYEEQSEQLQAIETAAGDGTKTSAGQQPSGVQAAVAAQEVPAVQETVAVQEVPAAQKTVAVQEVPVEQEQVVAAPAAEPSFCSSLFPDIVLEESGGKSRKKLTPDEQSVLADLEKLNINRLTPLKALNLLNDWQDRLWESKYKQ